MSYKDQEKRIKSERIAIWFDCICGIVCSSSAIFGIVFFTLQSEIMNPVFTVIGFVFMILYLLVSLFLTLYGLYSYLQEKKGFENRKKKKVLKPPII